MERNNAYLVDGGVGGINRSLVMQILEKGARNILLLISRKASSHAKPYYLYPDFFPYELIN
jgi:hypothetical protein